MRLPKDVKKRARNGRPACYVWRQLVRGPDGKMLDWRRSLGTDGDLVETRLDEAKAELERFLAGLSEPPPVLTVEALSRRWLAEYVASKRTPRGRAQAEQQSRDYLLPYLGSVPVSDLKPADIRGLSATLEAKCVGLVTRRRVLEDFRCCLRYAVEEAEVLARSPWRRGMMPTLPEQAPEPLSEKELAETVGAVPERWRPVLVLLASTGLRWGEVRALAWRDVREVPYRHLLVSRSHDGPTKSRKVREVPLMFEAPEVLAALGRPNNQAGLVFDWLPETASWVRRYVISHSRVKDFHVHRLRHTFATRYLTLDGRIETLQRILGHSDIKLTQRYARLRPWVVAAEVARITGTISGTTPVPESSGARKSLKHW